MSVQTQGTQVFFIDPEDDSVGFVQCATALTPGGSPADPIETTCLESFDREYVSGLRTPGQATASVNADPQVPSHVRLHEMSQENPAPTVKWAVAWSDGTAVPTVDSAGDFILPETRTWLVFQGYVADFPFDFQIGAVVTTAMTIQRSGGSTWVKKVAP
ncbi:MAG: phage tail protein [Pseudomonadales bacterium]|nr:phage tail protein [Pseudomonadales bacterium]|tara:strand:- start:614 stop:1090 length:477 start_codon:yes stop_codon:yes gene_type:complete